MRANALQKVAYEKYAEIMCRAPFDAMGLAVLDDAREIVWLSEEGLRKNIDCAVTELNAKSGVAKLTLANGEAVLCRPIRDFLGTSVGDAMVVLEPSTGNDVDTIASVLECVTECISREFQLTSELTEMAFELGERYEELNLVIQSHDHVLHGLDGPSAMEALVKDCVDYLDVNAAALAFVERGLFYSQNDDDNSIAQLENLAVELGIRLSEQLSGNPAALVLNSDEERAEIAPNIAYRIAACPVSDGTSDTAGVLFVLRPSDGREFTNSDRNILEVIAGRVGRVVRESYDRLTGLLNRQAYETRVADALATARRDNAVHSVLVVDIDQLKIINDTIGHDMGDDVIKDVARNIKSNVRRGDIVGRIGGDTFGMLLEHCALEQGVQIGEKLRGRIAGRGASAGTRNLPLSVSVGVARLDAQSESPSSVLDAAELAMRGAKESGRNRVLAFHEQDRQLKRRQEEMRWLAVIQDALRTNDMHLFCHAIEPTVSDQPATSFEVLIRLEDKDGHFVQPLTFLPAAERFQLMPTIDQWVVEKVLGMIEGNEDVLAKRGCRFTVNLSGQSLSDDRFKDLLLTRLDARPLPRHLLAFEVTETTAISNFENALSFLSALRGRGCYVYLDDFGTGFSSFEYLNKLPVDAVKIDGSFIRGLPNDSIAVAIVRAINEVAHVMGVETIAEYVENDAIRRTLADVGVNYVQGYAVGRPKPFKPQLQALIERE
jgi:diguanylate cyclase (GGDEF)-like protein